MAETPETSNHTSIKERSSPQFSLAKAVKEQIDLNALFTFGLPVKPLLHFEGNVTDEEQSGIPFSLNDYLELVDFTGRCIRQDKRGSIPSHLPPILQRLNIDRKTWLINATQFGKNYRAKFVKHSRQQLASA